MEGLLARSLIQLAGVTASAKAFNGAEASPRRTALLVSLPKIGGPLKQLERFSHLGILRGFLQLFEVGGSTRVAERLLTEELFALFRARPNAKLEWVAAHSGYLWNEYADSLASAWRRDEV